MLKRVLASKGRVLALGICLCFGFIGQASLAQGKFDPSIVVNSDAITPFEIDQRAKFLKVTGRRGNFTQMAKDGLIEDRLRMQAAKRAGILLTEEALARELENFASRANLSLQQLSGVLKSAGVDPITLRDFVEINVTWREVVRSRFAGRGQVSDAEIDRAMAASNGQGGLRVLFSEIVLPARPVNNEIATAKANAARLTKIRSISQFSTEARRLSASPTRDKGGKLDWINVSELPAPLRPILTNLKPGEVTAPLEVENAILLFQLRGIQEVAGKAPVATALEYATFDAPSTVISKIIPQVDVCDDLYGIAKKFKGIDLNRDVQKPSALPDDLRLELAKLDANEISLKPASQADTQTFTMLCGRTTAITEDVSRDEIAGRLRQRRLESLADGYLEELRSKAVIIFK